MGEFTSKTIIERLNTESFISGNPFRLVFTYPGLFTYKVWFSWKFQYSAKNCYYLFCFCTKLNSIIRFFWPSKLSNTFCKSRRQFIFTWSFETKPKALFICPGFTYTCFCWKKGSKRNWIISEVILNKKFLSCLYSSWVCIFKSNKITFFHNLLAIFNS